uniref:Lipoprotein n=1 Tax=Desulfobacca acetoxidans TaxID=60893 RepID=A0A7V4G988_9BACT
MNTSLVKVIVLIAFALGLGIVSVGCTGADIAAGVAQVLYAGLTGDEEGAAAVAEQVRTEVQEKERQELLLSQVPPAWKVEGAEIYFSQQVGTYVYVRPDQSWLKWNGSQWVLGE